MKIAKNITLLLLLACSAAAADTAFATDDKMAQPGAVSLTPAQALEDIALARRALSQLHPGYDRYTSLETLDAGWAALERAANSGLSRDGLYLELSRQLALIRCDHTKAELADDIEAARKTQPVYLPFRFKLFDGRMYVSVAADGLALSRGDEIIAIDGEPVGKLIADVLPLFPVDGDTDFIKEPSISDFGEFMGPAFDHFMPYLRALDATVALDVRRPDGSEATLTHARLGFTAFAAITGERRFSTNFVDAVRYEPLGSDAAYLAIDTFINYRKPVNPNKIFKPIFKQMKSQGRTKLILDLRNNGGGSDDVQTALLRWIMDAPFREADAVWTRFNAMDPTLKPYLSTWTSAALNPKPHWFEKLDNGFYKVVSKRAGAPAGVIKPQRRAFDGELVLLTSYDNASAVTHLLSALKSAGRGTFIGEPTGGAATGATAGVIVFLKLPNSGTVVRVPLLRTVMVNAEQFDPRLGITPDIEAIDTLQSFLAETDPALDAAKRHLNITK
ncbi:MAG: S41 family peptidase [Pseudomonadota bacterium]